MIISTYMQVMLRIWFKLGSFRVAKKKKNTYNPKIILSNLFKWRVFFFKWAQIHLVDSTY